MVDARALETIAMGAIVFGIFAVGVVAFGVAAIRQPFLVVAGLLGFVTLFVYYRATANRRRIDELEERLEDELEVED